MTDPSAVPVASPSYTRTIYARWGDMDFNGHMRNTAYLDAAGDIRMCFFADHGFTMREFARLQLGPVILRDTLEYYRELHLLEEVVVGQAMLGLSEDGSSWRMRNEFARTDGQRIARVESNGGWLDLVGRRLAPPSTELLAMLRAVRRTADFVMLDSILRR